MTDPRPWPMRLPLILGFACLLLLFGGCFAWSALMPVSGAIIATGRVNMAAGRQPVQHPEGGRVAGVFVTEGARVSAGTLLVRLDGAATRSDLAVTELRLAERLAERGRLEAERDGRDDINFPERLTALLATHPALARQVAAQKALLAADAAAFEDQQKQIARRRDQITEQVRGIDAQTDATLTQIDLLKIERDRVAHLVRKALVPTARLNDLDRELARMRGVLGSLRASRAEALARSSESALDALHLTSARRAAAGAALKEILGEEEELSERQRALTRHLATLDLRAPLSGMVLGLQPTSASAVLRPGEPAMYIVPDTGAFVIEARISASDIDQVALGQPARLRTGAFDARINPDLDGKVTRLAADAQSDQAGAAPYYLVEVTLTAPPVATLKPGMPVEVFLTTAPRTALSYLLDPFTRSLARAFRDG
jgi:HlyD family secretion protein